MSTPAGPLLAAAAPPTDRDALLDRVPPERQKLFALVVDLLAELDAAAPWDELYYPPDDAALFLARLRALVAVVEGVPARVRELVEVLTLVAPDEETRATLEEAEFYFGGIHSMCARDLERLRALLAPHVAAEPAPLLPAQRNFLCEVAADLKGKYTSALMGATASVVAEGYWSGVAVEPLLFPAKQDEARRNESLVRALERVVTAIRELPAQVPFAEHRQRWLAGARVDPYALADLATFRGVLGQLLKRDLRRALYSGDYHQIQRREVALAARIAELEAAHHRTWGELPASPEDAAATYRRLAALSAEIAAILDVELLESLLGAKAVKDLRAAATRERAGPGRRPLAPELEPLVPLVAEEDLSTFLELLLGSVRKRASLTAPAEAAPAPAAAGAEPATAPAPARTVKAARPLPAPAATRTQSTPPPAAAPLPPGVSPRDVVAGLHDRLVALQKPDNPLFNGFRMLQRLLGRHARIPPSMVQGAHPFLFAVLNELVPELEKASALGLVPPEARGRLVDCCLALTDEGLTPQQMDRDVPANLSRLQRLLEGLTAATAAQLRTLA